MDEKFLKTKPFTKRELELFAEVRKQKKRDDEDKFRYMTLAGKAYVEEKCEEFKLEGCFIGADHDLDKPYWPNAIKMCERPSHLVFTIARDPSWQMHWEYAVRIISYHTNPECA